MKLGKKFDPDSPTRPEFSIFEKVLGRKIEVPDAPSARHRLIEALFREAFEKKPTDLILAAASKQLRSFWNSNGNPPGMAVDTLVRVQSLLWERDPSGIPAKAREAYLGPSTNAISYYKADKHGLMGYLAQHVTWILSDLTTERIDAHKGVSIDHLKDQGIEPTTEHGFFRNRIQDDGRDEEIHEDAALGLGNTNRARAQTQMKEEGKDNDRTEDGIYAATASSLLTGDVDTGVDTTAEAALRPKYRALAAFDTLELRSKNRPDLSLFCEELQTAIPLAPDPETRIGQLRELATRLINERCGDMPDVTEALESVKDWPVMEKTFNVFFPEVLDWLLTHPIQMESKTTKKVPDEADMLPLLRDFDIISRDLDPNSQLTVAQQAVSESRLWRLRSTPEKLAKPDRPDYVYLLQRLGYKTPPLVDKEERMVHIRELSKECLSGLFAGLPYIRSRINQELNEWDPGESFFNEEITSITGRLIETGIIKTEDVSRITCSFASKFHDNDDQAYYTRVRAVELEESSSATRGAQTYFIQEVEDDAKRPKRSRRQVNVDSSTPEMSP